MMNGFVDIENEHFGTLSLLRNKPFLSEVNEPTAINEHKQLYGLIFPGVFDPLLQFRVGCDGINFVMDALTLE